LIEAWYGLETNVSKKGWQIYENVIGEADNESEDAQDEGEPVNKNHLE
jgi:hypothetical protein